MASYDPRVYQMQAAAGMHPGVLPNINQRFPRPGVNNPASSQPPQSGIPSRGGVPTPDTKLKAGPGWESTYRTAQNIAFPDPKAACGERVGDFVEDLARGIGCPVEFVLVPLLPCIGGLLGANTSILVHRSWSEPPVVWSAVGANGGSRRSAVIRQLLAPILTLQAQSEKSKLSYNIPTQNGGTPKSVSEINNCEAEKVDGNERVMKNGSSNTACQKRALYSGTRITLAALTEVLHRNDGHAFSLTENIENLHEMLGLLQAVPTPRLVSVMEDLYEGLPLVAVEDGRVTTILGSNFCHGGFTSPEYTVTMMLKSPPWLSARLLLSCPQADDMKGVFGELSSDSSFPELEQIYSLILDQHQVQRIYTFDPEAVRELNNFFDEEWSTVLNQLDQNEHEGIVGKSMGQIVRLSGILKALDNGIYGSSLDSDLDTWNWVIDVETVKNAITLGKYFLEQKLAMTFMVGTGFFSQTSDNSLDGVISENNENATTLPHTALPDNMSYQSSPYSTPQSSATSTTPKQMPVVGHARSLSQDLGPLGTARHPSQDLNSSNSQTSAPSTPSVPKQQGDVDFSNLPHTMTTVEEDVSEMMQAVDFVHFSKTQFVAVHGRRIKRLLECYDDGHGVSATTAAQKSITPPVRIEGTNNRHPAWASALFFQKVAELELGTAEQGRHPTNRKVCWRFKRKPISQLAEKDFQLLQYLRVEMDKYSQFGSGPFNPSVIVNSGLMTLPQSNSPGPHQHLAAMGVNSSPLSTDMNEDSNSQSSPRNQGNMNIKSEVF